MTAVEHQELLQKKAKVIQVLVSVLAIFLTVAVGMTLFVLLLQNQRLDQQGRILLECTTPPGARIPPEMNPPETDCYVRNNASTAHLLDDLNQVSIAAAACGAAHPGDIPATRKCVQVEIDRLSKKNGAGSGK